MSKKIFFNKQYYYDTLAGLIKVKFADNPHSCCKDEYSCVVTSRNNRYYRQGEVITCTALHLVQREHVHVRNSEYYILEPQDLYTDPLDVRKIP